MSVLHRFGLANDGVNESLQSCCIKKRTRLSSGKAQIIQQYGCFMICMPLSSVIAHAARPGAYPGSAVGSHHHRTTVVQPLPWRELGVAPVARAARKSAHFVSFPYPLSITLPRQPELRRASHRFSLSHRIATFYRDGSCANAAARALQVRLGLSSATKVGYSRGQCGEATLPAREGLARTPRWYVGPVPDAA